MKEGGREERRGRRGEGREERVREEGREERVREGGEATIQVGACSTIHVLVGETEKFIDTALQGALAAVMGQHFLCS